MDDGRIPKDILYGELALGRRTTGHPHLRYKDVCVRDMKAVDIDTMSLERIAADRTKLKQHDLKTGEDKLLTAALDKRACRKEGSNSIRPETTHRCDVCNKDSHPHCSLQPQVTLLQPSKKLKELVFSPMVISDIVGDIYSDYRQSVKNSVGVAFICVAKHHSPKQL